METKIFGGKKIKIRSFSNEDLSNARKWQDFINALVEEEAQILANKKKTLKEEVDWIKNTLNKIKDKKRVSLAVESNDVIVGEAGIKLGEGRQNHVGNLGISVRDGYRGIGLGNYLMGEIIKLAKKELKPSPKIIRLGVFSTNKPAIALYKKHGFREVATVPKQLQYQGKLIDEILMLLDL